MFKKLLPTSYFINTYIYKYTIINLNNFQDYYNDLYAFYLHLFLYT